MATNPLNQAWKARAESLGVFIRAQRRMADLSLREMAKVAGVSDAYLSQLERGLHQPSVRVIHAIADALEVSAETMLSQAGLWGEAGQERAPRTAEQGILADSRLSDEQKQTLLRIYQSFLAEPS